MLLIKELRRWYSIKAENENIENCLTLKVDNTLICKFVPYITKEGDANAFLLFNENRIEKSEHMVALSEFLNKLLKVELEDIE